MTEAITATVKMTITESGKRAPQYEFGGNDDDGHLTLADFLEYTKQVLIITADTVLAEEQAAGFDKDPVVVVDGKIGKGVFSVNPLGSIEFVARQNMTEILLATYSGIITRSPVDTGRYKSSNFVFLNGQQVATDKESMDAWLASNPQFKDSDLIRFVNIEPYARKLERKGITANKGGGTRNNERHSTSRRNKGREVLVPNGTYYLTGRSIRAKYKRNSTIKFEFITGAQLGIAGNFAPKKGKPGRPYLYPSILISVQESGIL